MKIDFVKLAKKAYSQYGTTLKFQDELGQPIPNWESAPAKIKEAWTAATQSIHEDVKKALDFDS